MLNSSKSNQHTQISYSGRQIILAHPHLDQSQTGLRVLFQTSQSGFDKEVKCAEGGSTKQGHKTSATIQTEADAVHENTTNHCSQAYFCPDSVYLTIVARREKNRSPIKHPSRATTSQLNHVSLHKESLPSGFFFFFLNQNIWNKTEILKFTIMSRFECDEMYFTARSSQWWARFGSTMLYIPIIQTKDCNNSVIKDNIHQQSASDRLCSLSGLDAAPKCSLARHKHDRLDRWGFFRWIVKGYFTLRVTRTNSEMPGSK